ICYIIKYKGLKIMKLSKIELEDPIIKFENNYISITIDLNQSKISVIENLKTVGYGARGAYNLYKGGKLGIINLYHYLQKSFNNDINFDNIIEKMQLLKMSPSIWQVMD